jgi:hypothetical protein
MRKKILLECVAVVAHQTFRTVLIGSTIAGLNDSVYDNELSWAGGAGQDIDLPTVDEGSATP